MAKLDSGPRGGQAVHRSKAEGALFTSQSWAEEPVLIRTPDPRLLTGKGRRCDLDVVVSHERFVTPLAAQQPPCHGVPAQNWAPIQGTDRRFCGTLLERPCSLLAPSCSVHVPQCRHGSVPGSQRARPEGLSSLRRARLSDSNGSQMRVLGAFNRVFSPYSVLHQHFLRLCFHGIKRSNF